MFIYFLLGIIASLVYVYYKVVKPSKYWEERDVVHVKSWPIVGSMRDFVLKKKHITEVSIDVYKQYPKARCVGYMHFTTPFLMLRDLELIKKVTVKDFDHFHDHLAFDNTKSDPLLSKSLVSLSGDNWRRMRATLSPAFTSSKMRNIYHLMSNCAENFANHFKGKKQVTVEMKEVFSKFANDVIATTAFGIAIDSMDNPDNEFFKMGSQFTNLGFFTTVKLFIMQLAPRLANLLRLQVFTEDVSSFFRSLVKDNIRERESRGIVRPDLIHLLMEARKGRLKHETVKEEAVEGFATVEESQIGKNTIQMELTDDHIVAQALAFFFAGFDTVSTAASFMALELALNLDVQKRLWNEIEDVRQHYPDGVPYEALNSMKYLDQVVCETLRLWPPGFQTDRLCVKDYVIEPINPKEKVVFVEKGTTVVIPVMALHRDPQYFPEPNKFDPERFSDENKSKIVPGSYLPFGLGPRNCIGSRFALLEIKILFFHLMSKFIILPDDETQFPVTISPKKINMAPETGFRLGLKPRIPAVVRLARTLEDLKASSATTDSHESVTLSAHDGTAQN